MYIGEAARLSATTVKTIRHYESIGLLPKPRRHGKYRIYDQHAVELLVLVKCAQKLGFTLREMQALMANDQTGRDSIRAAIAAKSAQVQQRIDQLQRQLADLHAFDASLQQIPDSCFHL
ncbi:MerR family transcriptional regulator [Pseudomonas sp. GD04058]|uniref:MerR family transcriptional regulator n=1 Tax=Pseudomonas sp. GD04058 TaxID=2975429 RepID=UPI00244BAD79|nr:MerR family transcriptional regulator [Pseudomonas sp. GD04058]MDG9882830.1 MerR family transcriptional regulator [Pseudomonas sp. GD04058]